VSVAVVEYISDFDEAFYDGSAVADASVVPGQYPVAINGHPYTLNTDPQAIDSYGDFFKEESLPLLRAQADQGRTAGEQSLSPGQFWRRSGESWHQGAGQSVYDREDSSPNRFYASKGVNPWTRYELSLLNDTDNVYASANSALVAAAAADAFYVADDTAIVRTLDLSAFATVSGTPATPATVMVSNGESVFTAHGTNGIYVTTGTTATSFATGTYDGLGFAKGRLLVSAGPALYAPTTSGAIGTAFFTVPSVGGSTWAFTAFAEGNQFIYAGGFAGNVSRIYRIGIDTDGATLNPGIVAATLPTGERLRSMYGYLGYLIIGTDLGVRFATVSNAGDLTLGALIPTPAAVYCIDASDRFVWFGWSNFDATSSGLGRLDLSVINDGLAPAYASDLMATGVGAVRGTGVIGSRRLFTVDGVGVFAEQSTSVASGYLNTGQITFGIADAKVPVSVDLKHSPLGMGASVSVVAVLDRGTEMTLGQSALIGSVSPTDPISVGNRRSEEVELIFTLTGTSLTRWTLIAYPAPVGTSIYTLPLILAERVLAHRDVEYSMNPLAEYVFLRDLHDSRSVMVVQLGALTFQGTLEEFTWLPHHHNQELDFWRGTFVAKIRRING
jgi:hypothetical protein